MDERIASLAETNICLEERNNGQVIIHSLGNIYKTRLLFYIYANHRDAPKWPRFDISARRNFRRSGTLTDAVYYLLLCRTNVSLTCVIKRRCWLGVASRAKRSQRDTTRPDDLLVECRESQEASWLV